MIGSRTRHKKASLVSSGIIKYKGEFHFVESLKQDTNVGLQEPELSSCVRLPYVSCCTSSPAPPVQSCVGCFLLFGVAVLGTWMVRLLEVRH